MTTWSKRIDNCPMVIDRVLNNTIVPNSIYINLSEYEFPNHEKQLPVNFVQMCETHDIIQINWVPGPDTKTMKKVIPILPLLDKDDIIMTIDDDMLLEKDHIQSRYTDFVENGRQKCITTHHKFLCGNNMFSRMMLNGYEMFLTEPIMSSYDDDAFYTCLLYINGFGFVPGSDYTLLESEPKTKHQIMNWFNSVESMWNSGKTRYNTNKLWCEFGKRASEIFHKPWSESFGVNANKCS